MPIFRYCVISSFRYYEILECRNSVIPKMRKSPLQSGAYHLAKALLNTSLAVSTGSPSGAVL